ncbi:MAG: T9SS type A sorting domain-containing protein, partial [Ferruginibacter sp.]
SYVDNSPLPGRNLYRIAARKRSGSVVYSKAVSIDNQGISLISLYPNPVADKLFIRLGSMAVRLGNWSVHNENGQRVLSGRITSSGPIECITLPHSLPAGTYRFSLFSEGKIASRLFVKGR